MTRRIHVLHLDDSQDDALLVARTLARDELECEISHVTSVDEFLVLLDRRRFDIILADYSVPGHDGRQLLETVLEYHPDTPFIYVSGAIGEETAIELIRLGATDYVLKHRLQRLPMAIERAIRSSHQLQERIRMERDLGAALQLQSDVLDALPANVALIDRNGRIISINDSWKRFAEENGYPVEGNGLGANYLDVSRDAFGLDAEFGRTTAEGLEEILAGQREHFELEYPCHSPTQRRWFQLVARRFESDRSQGAVVMHIDITERKKAELALKQSQEFYELIIGNISDTVLMTDERGFFTYICPNVEIIFGYTNREVAERETVDRLLGTQLFPNGLHIPIGGTHKFDHEITDKWGDIRNLTITVKHVSIGDGTFLLTCHDITQQKRAEKKMLKTLATLEATIESTRDGIAIIGANGRFSAYNRRAIEMWNIPHWMLITGESGLARNYMLDQLRDRDSVARRLEELDDHSNEITYEVLECLDGRVIERYSFPQMLDGQQIGTILNYREITERRHAEEALRASEQRYRRIVENAADLIFVTDPLGNFTDVNGYACEMLGYSREELLKMSVADIRQDYDPIAIPAMWQSLDFDAPATIDSVHIRKDRTAFPVEVRLVKFEVESGYQVLALARDITERKRAVDEMNGALSLLSATFESTADGIAAIDRDGDLMTYNHRLLELWDIEIDLNATSSREQIRRITAPCLRTDNDDFPASLGMLGSPELDHIVLELVDGTILERYSHPQLIGNRNVGWVLSFHDITAHETARRQLREQSLLLRTVIDSSDDAIFARDNSHRFLLANRTFADYYAQWTDEIVGRTIHDILPPDEDFDFLEFDQQVLTTGKPITYEETVTWGTKRRLLVTKAPMRNSNGQIVGIVGTARDITERYRHEEEKSRMLSLLTATLESATDSIIAVDLDRNPLIHNAKMIEMWRIPQEIAELGSAERGRDYISTQLKTPLAFLARTEAIYQRPEEGSFDVLECLDGRIIERYSQPQLLNGRVVGRVWSFRDITARHHAAEAVTESESRFRRLVENAADCFFVHDRNGRFIDVNNRACESLGYTREEFLRMTITDIEPSYTQKRLDHLWETMELDTPITLEGAHTRKDGSSIPVELRLTKFRWRGEQQVLALARDISERKEAEAAVRSARTRLAHLLANSPALLYSLRHDGNDYRLYWASDNSDRVIGYSIEEVMRPSWWIDNVHPDDLEVALATTGHLLTAEVDRSEYRFRYKDGTYHWISDEKRMVYDDDGRPVEIVGLWVDITERKQAEIDLRNSRNLMNAVIEAASDAIFARSIDGIYLLVNTADARLMGSTTEKMIGSNVRDIVSPQMDPAFLDYDRRVIVEGTSVTYEFPMSVDGQYRTILFTKEPLRDDNGRIIGVVGIGRDITERKQAEDRIASALSMLSATLESTADGIIVVDSRGNPAAHNRKFIDMWNLTEAPNLLREAGALWQYMAGQVVESTSFIAQMLGQDMEPDAILQDTFDCRDGRVFERNSQPTIVSGRHAGRVWSFRDVTQRIRAERELQKSRNLLHYVIEAAEDSIFARDLKGNYLLVNSAAASAIGKRPEELIGRNVADFSEDDHLNTLKGHDLEIIAQGKAITYEHALPGTDPVRTALTTKAPLRDDRGQVIGIVGIGRDITERKRIEETLRNLSNYVIEAQETERRRVALELHDGVNQMLSAAKFKILSAERKLADPTKSVADEVAQARELINKTIAEVRNISKNLRPSVLDDLGFITALQSLCQEFSERTGIVMNLSCDELSERLPRQIEVTLFRIIQESLNNIEKHSGATSVEIFFILTETDVNVTVRDNGTGFDPDVLSQRKEGSHLGLVGMKERAGYVSGTATIESWPGKGTTVRVSIPSDLGANHGGEIE